MGVFLSEDGIGYIPRASVFWRRACKSASWPSSNAPAFFGWIVGPRRVQGGA